MASAQNSDDEDDPTARDPLIDQSAAEDPPPVSQSAVPGLIVRRLYLSHFLSTWNSRVFEFGAVLYLASVFPGTLLPVSVYAFTRGLSAIIFAPAMGHYIDTGNRLQVVRVSIVVQRPAVAASCAIFYILAVGRSLGGVGQTGMLVLLAFLACLEKLASIVNLVSVEKDWVVVAAQNDEAALREMNAQMRRIDLLCKLFGPLVIALIDGVSTKAAIIANFTMNIASVGVEYVAIARVYRDIPDLQGPKQRSDGSQADSRLSQGSEGWIAHNWRHLRAIMSKSAADFNLYLHHRAFLPSMAGALLYLTVLSFAGQMVTYLLASGYSATQVSVARTLSVALEVLATWIAPWLMARIGVVRAGLWLSSWQVMMLAAGTALYWAFMDQPIISSSALVGGTILSRVGLRGFDLCTQLIVQEDVEAENRGIFSSVESAWQNAFELLSFASTIQFSRPGQFRWPVLISVIAVTCASSAYAFYVRLRRGHLVHFEAVMNLLATGKGRRREQERALERITSNSDI